MYSQQLIDMIYSLVNTNYLPLECMRLTLATAAFAIIRERFDRTGWCNIREDGKKTTFLFLLSKILI